MSAPSLHPDTRLAHAGAVVDPATRAVVASPVFATTFERGPDGGYPGGHVYARTSNPTRDLLEAALADLEGGGLEEGASAAAFASGLAACHAVLAPLAPGSRVLIPTDVYHGLRGLLRDVFGHLRVEAVAMDDTAALVEALGRGETALVWLETPSNPLLRVTDLAAAIAAAHAAGARVAVDNTWPTPLLTRPLALGADYSVHSLTKAIAGHSDVLGGAVVARTEALMAPVRAVQASAGGVLDPFSSWLTLRGMRTLALRIERASATAAALADLLDGHAGVSAVHYPGLATHPGHAVAARQMRLGGRRVLRRDAVGRGRGRCRRSVWRGRRAPRRQRPPPLPAGDLARRHREPGRAPRVGRGAGHADAARPPPPLHRHRTRRRPRRRPARCPRRTLPSPEPCPPVHGAPQRGTTRVAEVAFPSAISRTT